VAHQGWTKSKPQTIDQYLASLDDEKRAALEKLRQMIHSVVPEVEECISYSLPAFRLNGKLVAGFGASANHCAYYPMSGSIVETHRNDLTKYETSKGAIRFQADKPLPISLIQKLVKARIAESD
jgi:uncharacterized protein YdhG (YjbR/CyaY superfamily)